MGQKKAKGYVNPLLRVMDDLMSIFCYEKPV